ncbi:MAG TPA: CAP domain-containing protein, partial [Patescibacteria group bacterium]|nr:CAP domain-containing protein [Patescibacteria group bacterium]
VDGWMNSPSHRKNILYTDFNEAGIGVANINGYIIATQSFIRRTNCGYKGGSCCEKTGYYPYCYTPWQCQEGSCVSASTQN